MRTRTIVTAVFALLACAAPYIAASSRPTSRTVLLHSAAGESTFRVPAVGQVVGQSMFSFYVKYPRGNLFVPTKALVSEDVRVLVAASERGHMRSNRELGDRYALVETRGRFKVYQASHQSPNSSLPTVETVFVTTDAVGQRVTITDPGAWSGAFRVYRAYSDAVELDYQFRKGLGIAEFEKIDAFVLNLVHAMQVAN